MKIGIDLRPLQDASRYRGIGSVVKNVVSQLGKIDKKNDYYFYCYNLENPEEYFKEFFTLPKDFSYQYVLIPKPEHYRIRHRIKDHFFPQKKLTKKELDVYFQTDISYGIPKGDVPVVSVIYDVIPLLFKKHYSHTINFSADGKKEFLDSLGRIVLWWLSSQNQKQITKVKKLISISENSKKDFLKFFKYNPDDIVVVPLAADEEFKPNKGNGEVLKKYGIKKPFLIYAGGCDFRKNITTLITAFEKLKTKHDIQLVLVGKAFTENRDPASKKIIDQINLSKYKLDIITPGYVDTKELVELYSNALSFVFPTIYEGFGLPILEAFACGCPVISYNNSSIPEVSDDAALLLDTKDELETVIDKLITDKKLRDKMIEKGFNQSKNFSWGKTAKDIIALIEKTK